MTNLLVVGLGKHTKKKIIPACEALNINLIGFLTNRTCGEFHDKIPIIPLSEWSAYVPKLISNFGEITVLVASPPAAHFENILNLNKLDLTRFIIEKPAVINALQLSELRRQSNIDFQIINMYEYSPVWKNFTSELRKVSQKYRQAEICVELTFTIPDTAIDDLDFRKASSKDGGALIDIGYYPISAAYLIGNELGISPKITWRDMVCNQAGVPKYGKFEFENQNLKIIGKWGFSDNYANSAVLRTKSFEKEYSFIFSKPNISVGAVTTKIGATSNTNIILEHDDQYHLNLRAAIDMTGRNIMDPLIDFVVSEFGSYKN